MLVTFKKTNIKNEKYRAQVCKSNGKLKLFVFLATLLIILMYFLAACNTSGAATDAKALEQTAATTLQTANNFETSNELTTFGGADINSDSMKNLKNKLENITKTGKFVSFTVINTKTQSGFSYQADKEAPGKSTIKAPYITSLILNDQAIFKENNDTIKKIITISDNDAYVEMRSKYGNETFEQFMKDAGVDSSKSVAIYPLNMTTRDMVKMWCKMYPLLRGNLGKSDDMGEYAGYFKCTAYSPFSTVLWRDNNVMSKAGWDEGIRIGDDGIYENVMKDKLRDKDPKNDEEAMNDTGIVSSTKDGQYGDYIFAYFTDFPAISDIMYPLVQAVHEAAVSLG